MINPRIANPQIFSKYCTTASQNSSNSHIFKLIFLFCTYLNLLIIYYIFKETKSVFVDLLKFWSAKKLGPANRKPTNYNLQITKKTGPATCKFTKCDICGTSANLFKSANLRICDLRSLFTDPLPLIDSSQIGKNIKSFV